MSNFPLPTVCHTPAPEHWNAFRERLAGLAVMPFLFIYYEGWVRQWLEADLEPVPCQAPEQVFAHWLEVSGTASWKCRQAFHAVQLWRGLDLGAVVGGEISLPIATTRPWADVLEELERHLRVRHYSPRTCESYVAWARRLSLATPVVPANSVEASSAVTSFLQTLALSRNLAPASLAQCRNALAYLVKQVLGHEMVLTLRGNAHKSRKLPTVLAPSQVRRVLDALPPAWGLFFALQYGCGMRLMEILELRVQDINLFRMVLTIRQGKGAKDRALQVPNSLVNALKEHIANRRKLWESDREAGWARVELPHAMGRKLQGADCSWEWQHVFGAHRPLRFPGTGERRRWHPMEISVRAALQAAAKRAGIIGRVHPHLLRHCYASHLLEAGVSIRDLQELLGHARLETTMVYLHVRAAAPRSPLDLLQDEGAPLHTTHWRVGSGIQV